MKKITRRLLSFGLWSITVSSFATVLSSTLAWFAYYTRVSVVMEGTVVRNASDLQVGIKTPISTFSSELIEDFELVEVSVNEDKYTFSPAGTGLSSRVINHYLEVNDYAIHMLQPVTSKRYNIGEDLYLKQAPYAGKPKLDAEATIDSYVKIPFAFRILKGVNEYSINEPIWLTNSECKTDYGDNIINKAVRVYFDGCMMDANDNIVDNKFIYNPSSNESGYDNVAGVLNLDHDEYYDFGVNDYLGGSEEIIYGDYDGEIPTSSLREEDSELDDINNTGNDSILTTFTSKHKEGQYCFSNYNGLIPHKANYLGKNDIKPIENPSTQILSGGRVLTLTNSNGIAELDTTIYIEGWNHAVINQQASHSFSLGLTFEINRGV